MMMQHYCLKRQLDTAAAPSTAADLIALQGGALQLDGSEVVFAGALGLQVLISAKMQWDADSCAFALSPISRELAQAADCLGVDLQDIGACHSDICAEGLTYSMQEETVQ